MDPSRPPALVDDRLAALGRRWFDEVREQDARERARERQAEREKASRAADLTDPVLDVVDWLSSD